VTVRGAFQGAKLTPEGEAKLASLGRVASAHPEFAVQVVLHDAESPSAKDDGDARRTAAVVKALLAGGAPAARVKAELAGTGAPLVDPSNAKLRSRNERLDVVFVAGS
jgi:outer membrane protein OmpA-like peptidoglycan-associated protein